MKKMLITPLLGLILLAGCSKRTVSPSDDKSNGEKKLLSFTIDGFSQELLPFTDKIKNSGIYASANQSGISSNTFNTNDIESTDIRDHVNALEIKIFQNRVMVDSIRQYAGDPAFGTYKGYYDNTDNIFNIFIAAAHLENEGDFEMKRGPNDAGGYSDTYIKILPSPSDAFFTHHTVSLKDGDMHQNLKLKRFVGRLEVNLTEEIPADAHHIEIAIDNTAQYFLMIDQRGYRFQKDTLNDNLPYQTVKVIDIKPEDLAKEEFSFNAYFVKNGLLSDEAQTTKVTLKAFDAENNLLQSREIPNVLIQTNMRTKLSGRLFTAPNMNFDVEIDGVWNEEIPEFEF